MSATSAFDIRLVFGLTEQVQSLEDQNGEHEEMDTENGESFLVEHENPEPDESDIGQRENEVDSRENGFTGGEIIPAITTLPFEIVHDRFDVHGDPERLKTIGEEKRVLIGIGLREHGGEAIAALEFLQGVDGFHERRLERASDLSLLELLEDVDP